MRRQGNPSIHSGKCSYIIIYNVINKKTINCLWNQKDIFMKCFNSNSFIKLDSFYDSRIE